MSFGIANNLPLPTGLSVAQLATDVMRLSDQKNLSLAVAESCTGGLVSSLLTDVEGHSHCFECGFVAFSDRAKQEMIDFRTFCWNWKVP